MLTNITQQDVIEVFLNRQHALSLNAVQWSKLVVVLRSQNMLPRIAALLRDEALIAEVDIKTQRHLNNALIVADQQLHQVKLEASKLQKLLSLNCDYVVFLKGAAYSLLGAQVSKGRICSDIDVLVPKQALPECERALTLQGWVGQEITNYDDKYYRKWAHEIPPLIHNKRGTVIDVHHNIIPVISKQAPDPIKFLPHIVTLDNGVQVLSEAAQFMHSAVHLFRNEDYQTSFRDLCDLYLMLDGKNEAQLLSIIEVTRQFGFEKELGLAFYSLQQHLRIQLPESISSILLQHAFRVSWLDKFIFNDVLLPQHALLANSKTSLKHSVAMIRGHIIKMPLPILIYHLVVKSGRSLIETLFGKHVFTAKDDNPLAPANQALRKGK